MALLLFTTPGYEIRIGAFRCSFLYLLRIISTSFLTKFEDTSSCLRLILFAENKSVIHKGINLEQRSDQLGEGWILSNTKFMF